MNMIKLAPAAANARGILLIGQPVRVCQGTLAGLSGTLAQLRAGGRASIKLQQGVTLEIDRSVLEPARME
ncbi:MAG: hypothetical protein ACYC0X_03600 [Pirellulaceae bacterium]